MELNAVKVKQLRSDKGWTQQQLAEICGLSLRTIQRIEVQGIASLETSKALAAAFEIDRATLLAPPAEQPPQQTWVQLIFPISIFTAGMFAGMLVMKLFNLA